MRIRLDRGLEESLLAQARDQIISALHAGMLRRGDRLPSLRQIATQSRLNVKTVLKVYSRLRNEGLLEMRPGSGAFVNAYDRREFAPAQALRLRRFLQRHLDEASGMSIPPGSYSALVQSLISRSSLKGASVAVVECNQEQVNLYAREISSRIGVEAHPVLIDELSRKRTASIVRSSSIIAVTDFHMKEGTAVSRRFGKPLLRLRLRREFLPALMSAARRGRLLMIVSSAAFIPAFKRALGLLGLRRDEIDRLSAVEGSNPRAVAGGIGRADSVYLSPLCDQSLRSLVPKEVKLITFASHLDAESFEELEAWLLLSRVGTAGNGRATRGGAS